MYEILIVIKVNLKSGYIEIIKKRDGNKLRVLKKMTIWCKTSLESTSHVDAVRQISSCLL